MINLSLLLLMIFSFSAWSQDPLWHAHEGKKMSEQEMLKFYLSFILTQNRASAGLAFILLDPTKAEKTYQKFNDNEEFKLRIGVNHFRSFKTFSKRMENLAYEIPQPRQVLVAENDAIIRTAFYFKRMRGQMAPEIRSFESSLDNIQLADYRKSSIKFHEQALKLCEGDIKDARVGLSSVPKNLLNLAAISLTAKDCREIVKDDILDIVNPYDNPVNLSEESSLEGTGIYLAKQLIPGPLYQKVALHKALIKTIEIDKLDARQTLFEEFKDKLGLNGLDTVRLISLANHNHGLEFFVVNAIIDLAQTDTQAIKDVKVTYKAINHLYELVQKHEEERAHLSKAPQDQLERKYHYWGGVFMTCELMKRDYAPYMASFMSRKLGELYEVNTSGSSEADVKGMKNDILLHHLGAIDGQDLCY